MNYINRKLIDYLEKTDGSSYAFAALTLEDTAEGDDKFGELGDHLK